MKKTPLIETSTCLNKKVAIVYSSWHPDYVDKIREQLKNNLQEIEIDEIKVPGSNEVPWVASKIARDYDGIICVGILIKGDTLHFENISSACSIGIMQAQIMTGVPMLNVILSCYDFDQLEERITGDKSTLNYITDSLREMMKY
jgi:6,7-dimethyl-8-ribityllumazine synthase